MSEMTKKTAIISEPAGDERDSAPVETRASISRRQVLRTGMYAGFGTLASAGIAACGGGSDAAAAPASAAPASAAAAAAPDARAEAAKPKVGSIFDFDINAQPAAGTYQVGPLESVYVPMRDGVRIALDIVRPLGDASNTKRGTILMMTRYWRGTKGSTSNSVATAFVPYGYAVVVGDVRGTGASFGVGVHERTRDQTKDFDEVLTWIAAQGWSNGSVVGYGHSSPGNMAEFMAIFGNPALKGIMPESDDYSGYLTIFPNGVPNTVTWPAWSDGIYQQDHNIGGSGVRPVGTGPAAEALLAAAVAEHTAAPLWDGLKQITYIDDQPTTWGGDTIDVGYIQNYVEQVNRSNTPTQYWSGWWDAATPEGSARRFVQMTNPQNVIIGPWPHGYNKPYDPLNPTKTDFLPATPGQKAQVLHFADVCLTGQAAGQQGKVLHYYTLGEGVWKSTSSWPPKAKFNRLYMGSAFRLNSNPEATRGSDSFQVDPELADVANDRWTSTSGTRVNFGDRRQFDAARVAYTSDPLTEDTEITGHPVVHLNVSSTREDGNFFVYLEGVAPDGSSCYLTEGLLRALHRKVDHSSPFAALGPQHSCLKRDAEPLVPGQSAILEFALQPISALLPKGYCVRVVLAGSNKTRFEMVPADGTPPLLNFNRGGGNGCYIDLPIVQR
ncbi:hypothetical protein VAR608DRAFT_0255 [Variovorax sp. HW608]|uniref:CocE/NonD family hydrolase n=1 Tax=Variovorax sp. HW608 TaxID=1034889 RepID=UPI00081F9619|nr:CocE/NonD family hydrolase [Variovorax sp. HW608]SCK08547.1 hypothetical protein VAR608DRAFT_0255 [Variovorax sp. HW608]